MSETVVRYLLYVTRWGVLAIPGHWFLECARINLGDGMPSMIVSQVILGAIVFFIDQRIFNWSPKYGKPSRYLS